jgi:predicted TIM-barrel fold metal-dependent hydrolase
MAELIERDRLMGIEEQLNKGERTDFHVHLYASELAVVDAIASKYDCSRSAVIAAWSREYAGLDLTGKVEVQKSGRRVAKKGA